MRDLRFDNYDTSSKTPAGLAKSHRLIKTQKDKEIQFFKLCEMIKLEDFKKERSNKQKQDRRLKRQR